MLVQNTSEFFVYFSIVLIFAVIYFIKEWQDAKEYTEYYRDSNDRLFQENDRLERHINSLPSNKPIAPNTPCKEFLRRQYWCPEYELHCNKRAYEDCWGRLPPGF